MTQADSVHSTPPPNASAIEDRRSPENAPVEPAGALYVPTDATPEQIFQAIGRLRKEARDEIERLLTFLDAIEDPDLEDGGDAEPDLGSVGICNPDDQTRWAAGSCQDLERDHDGAEPEVCDEPSLGSADGIVDQSEAWRQPPAWVIDGEFDVLDNEDDDQVRDSNGAMTPTLNQVRNPNGDARDHYGAGQQATKLLIKKRSQVRARKARREASGSLTHAR